MVTLHRGRGIHRRGASAAHAGVALAFGSKRWLGRGDAGRVGLPFSALRAILYAAFGRMGG